jgi:3-hydroxyisobutyrate dehydrogenase-like beta-hydroxyacid dehydrogenase
MNTTRHREQVRKPSTGFIGMGYMGSSMARRLLDAGYPLTAYDRTPARAEQLKQQGPAVAQMPKDLAAQCEVVMVCVTDDAAKQMYAAALAKGMEADFSVMIRFMEELAGVSDTSGTTTRSGARAEV